MKINKNNLRRSVEKLQKRVDDLRIDSYERELAEKGDERRKWSEIEGQLNDANEALLRVLEILEMKP